MPNQSIIHAVRGRMSSVTSRISTRLEKVNLAPDGNTEAAEASASASGETLTL